MKKQSRKLFDTLPTKTKKDLQNRLIEAAEESPFINQVVNSRPAHMSTRNRTAIDIGLACLANAKIIPPPVHKQKTQNVADIFLNGIGISLTSEERGHTLLSNPESAENLEQAIIDKKSTNEYNNPNILNSDDYSFIKNENISMEISFASLNDPFYELDNGTSQYYAKQKQRKLNLSKKPDLIHISARLSTLNIDLNCPTKKLKHFDGRTARVAYLRSKF